MSNIRVLASPVPLSSPFLSPLFRVHALEFFSSTATLSSSSTLIRPSVLRRLLPSSAPLPSYSTLIGSSVAVDRYRRRHRCHHTRRSLVRALPSTVTIVGTVAVILDAHWLSAAVDYDERFERFQQLDQFTKNRLNNDSTAAAATKSLII